jgi:hypothetical protein
MKNDYQEKIMQSQVFAGPCVVEYEHHAAKDGWNYGYVRADGGDSEVESIIELKQDLI